MNKSRWKYLKALAPPAPTYKHESCVAFMAEDPRSQLTGIRMPLVPRVVLTGGTYNVGRNASKRSDRNADIKIRAVARKVA